MAPRERGELLRRAFELINPRGEKLAVLMTLEMGKTVPEFNLDRPWQGREVTLPPERPGASPTVRCVPAVTSQEPTAIGRLAVAGGSPAGRVACEAVWVQGIELSS